MMFTPGSIKYYCGFCQEFLSAEWSSDVINHIVTQHTDRDAADPTIYITTSTDDSARIVLNLLDCTAEFITPE